MNEPTAETRSAEAEVQVEITSEMIEAGETELLRYNSEYESAADAARRIYEAMTNASSSRHE